jgi:hypothetical protein
LTKQFGINDNLAYMRAATRCQSIFPCVIFPARERLARLSFSHGPTCAFFPPPCYCPRVCALLYHGGSPDRSAEQGNKHRSGGDPHGRQTPSSSGGALIAVVKFLGPLTRSIKSTERRLVTKIITLINWELRDQSIKPNYSVIGDWLL